MRCMRKKQTGKCLCRSSSAIMQQTRDAALIPKPALSAKLKSASAFELGNQEVIGTNVVNQSTSIFLCITWKL